MNILQALVQQGLITASEMEETKLDKEMISTEELEAIMIELKREEIVKEFLYHSEEISRLFGDAEEEAKKIANSLNHSVADSSNNENTNRNASLINLIIPFARRINQTNDFKLVDALLQELKIKIAELEPSDARPFCSGFVGTDIYPFALFCDVLQYRKRNLHERAIGLCDEFMQLPGVEATNLYGLVLYLRGCCMMDLKRNVEAIIDFTKVISVYQYFRAYISRSVVFQRTGNVEKAFNDVNVAIENNQDVALLFKCRGDLYSKSLKNHELALRDYNQAILLSSDYFSAYQDRARVFLNLKQYDMALADYTRCIKLKPNSIPCLLERAKLLEQLRNIEDARYDYIQILKMDPNNMDVSQRLQQLGSPKSLPSRQESPSRSVTHKVPSPSKQGHLENVRAILQSKIIEVSQANTLSSAFRICQTIIDILDLHSSSIRESFIDTIIKSEDGSYLVRLLLPLFYKVILKDSSKAIEGVNLLLATLKDNNSQNNVSLALLLIIRAMCNEDLGNTSAALIDYDEIVQKFEPKFVHAHLRRAILFLTIHEPDEALKCLDTCLKIDARNTAALNMKNKALQMKAKNSK